VAGRLRESLVSGQEAVLRLTVSFVVPLWNQAGLLRRLLESVARQTRKPDEVIVVDNGSTDDAPDLARRCGARVIALGQNRGFAAAVNCGVAACSADWIALINSDVELRPDWLEKLLGAASDTGASFCCGKLFKSGDRSTLDGTWDLIASSGFPQRAGNGQPDSPAFGSRRLIAMAPATATLYRHELFASVGVFDERYGSYLEDVDFSLRCAMAGFAGVYEPEAVAYHLGGASGGSMVRLYARNQVLLVRKLFPLELQRKFRRRIVLGRLLWGALALRHLQFGVWVKGLMDARRTSAEPAPLDAMKLERLLLESEREINSIRGSDLYWRLYFHFTQGESR
jgi:GT2 family glycosyltransferase